MSKSLIRPVHLAWLVSAACGSAIRSEFEVDKGTTEILVVLFDPVVQWADVRLIQKAQDFFLELPAAFAGNNLDQLNLLVKRGLHNAIELDVNLTAAIVDVV
jgi:hypothetical protein